MEYGHLLKTLDSKEFLSSLNWLLSHSHFTHKIIHWGTYHAHTKYMKKSSAELHFLCGWNLFTHTLVFPHLHSFRVLVISESKRECIGVLQKDLSMFLCKSLKSWASVDLVSGYCVTKELSYLFSDPSTKISLFMWAMQFTSPPSTPVQNKNMQDLLCC